MNLINELFNFLNKNDANPEDVNANFDEIRSTVNSNLNGGLKDENLAEDANISPSKLNQGEGSGLVADTVDGKHYIDIQNWVNTSADVPNADYADNAGNADYADNAGNAANAGSLENNTIVDILKKGYPVGSIYINANNGTNPATLLGFGTWERFGEGRVLVSQDSTDADFDAIGETGGEKTHQLTVDEMPSHNHNYTRVSGGAGGGGLNVDGSTSTAYTSLAGGDFPHNNLQPYITVYMWKRTA